MTADSIEATVRGLSGELPTLEPLISNDDRTAVDATIRELRPYWTRVL
jgi:hypothetical protein